MENGEQRKSTGIAHIALLLANIGWGVIAPVSKMVLLSGTISSMALSGIRITGGALLFLIFTWILPKSMETRQRIEKKDLLKLILASALIISANQGLYIIGVGLTDPIDSAVMCSLTPVLTMILAAIFLHFRMTWLKVAGVIMGLVGVLMLVAGTSENEMATNPVLGNFLCLGAQLCAAIYYIGFEGIIRKYSPYVLMKWMFFISVLTYVPFCMPDMLKVDYLHLSGEVWAGLAFIITIPTFFGYLMIPLAQRSLRPTVVSAYSYLQPVFAAIVAVMMQVGDFGWDKALATALIFIGIYFVNKSSESKGKPIIIRCRFMRSGYCLNLFGTYWSRETGWIDRYVINHERIHTQQMKELLFIPFYFLYVLEWALRLLQYRNRDKAYRNISFEREAYAHGDDLTYLDRRRRYAFLKFLSMPKERAFDSNSN